MGAYNFKSQFEPDIMADLKRHTIRAKRRHPDKPGSLLSLFVGMRTKKCRLLKRRLCVKVQDISIGPFEITRRGKTESVTQVLINGILLTACEMESLAKSDGFKSFAEMERFWDGRLPFEGDIIHWESDAAAAGNLASRTRDHRPETRRADRQYTSRAKQDGPNQKRLS